MGAKAEISAPLGQHLGGDRGRAGRRGWELLAMFQGRPSCRERESDCHSHQLKPRLPEETEPALAGVLILNFSRKWDLSG